MSLSASDIAAVVAELQPLVGGALQKVHAPSPRSLVLEVRVPGETHLLLVSAEADETRLHLAAVRPASPAAPLPLQNLLRAHAVPGRIAAISAVPGDRVARIDIDAGGRRLSLVAELTGRHGNLFLLDDAGIILGSGAPNLSTRRALVPGAPWEPLAPRPARPSPPRFAPGPGPFPLSAAIDREYGPLSRERVLSALRREAGMPLAAALRRITNALARIEEEERGLSREDELRRHADALKTMLGKVPRGATSVRGVLYTDRGPEPIDVPLRPELGPQANLDRLYKQVRRLSATRNRIGARREELGQQRQRLDELGRRLVATGSESEIEEVARAAAALGARARIARSRAAEAPRTAYRAYRSATGSAIWVGKGARQNDELTFRAARGSDAWLHARGVPGAHVVVPLPRGSAPDQETLLDACALAVHGSGARGEAVAEVSFTYVRNVRKQKGAPAGSVVVTQERTVAYRHDAERLARLLAGDQAVS